MKTFKSIFIADKNFWKMIWVLLLPIIGQQLVSNMVVFLDNFMVSQISNEALAGVYIANQYYFVASVMLFGLGAGTSIFMAQFKGINNSDGVSYSFRWSIKYSIGIMLFMALIAKIFMEDLLSLFSSDPEIISEAKSYFDVILISYILSGITIAYAQALRTIGKAKWTLYNELFALLTNVLLNYMFIYGNLGAPKWGVAGAAFSTLLSRAMQVCWYVWMAGRADDDLKLKRTFTVKRTIGLTKDILKKAWPMVTNELFWSLSFTFSIVIVTLRGDDVLKAYSIRQSISMFSYIIFGATAGAMGVMVGQPLGRNDSATAMKNFRNILGFGFYMAIFIVILNWTFADIMIDLFEPESESVRKYAKDFLIYGSLLFPIFIINATSFYAVRSGGKMFFTFMLDSVWNWVIFIPALYLCFKSDLPVIYAFMLGWGTDVLKLLVMVPYVLKGKWLINIVDKYGKKDEMPI